MDLTQQMRLSRYYRALFSPAVTMIIRFLAPALAALPLTLIGAGANADEADPPLFVASAGVDTGDCRNSAAPCRSIDYALQRIGKYGQIRVAAGTYELAAVENVVYLLSGAIDVHGGYRESDQFAVRSGGRTTLVGVPVEYAAKLAERGFDVIVDSKGLSAEQLRRAALLVTGQQSLQTNTGAIPCSNG